MLISEIKPIGKFGKKFLENEDADKLIEKIIEKPFQKACKDCKEKNIETLMCSANKKNLPSKKRKRVDKSDVLVEIAKKEKIINLGEAGKGYAWLLINFNTLSDENKEIFFSLEDELGEDTIWFVKSTYIDNLNDIIKRFKFKEIVQKEFDDKHAEEFKKRQIPLMYNIRYPVRTVCVRMPIDENTESEEVEAYYDKIISRLVNQ